MGSLKVLTALPGIVLASCAPQGAAPSISAQGPTQRVAPVTVTSVADYGFGRVSPIVLSSGQSVGGLRVAPWPNSVAFGMVTTGLSAGMYRVRVHEVGRCDAPHFSTAGGPWSKGPIDLGPKVVGPEGRLYVTALLEGAKLRPTDAGGLPALLDSNGASILMYSESGESQSTLVACAVVVYP